MNNVLSFLSAEQLNYENYEQYCILIGKKRKLYKIINTLKRCLVEINTIFKERNYLLIEISSL